MVEASCCPHTHIRLTGSLTRWMSLHRTSFKWLSRCCLDVTNSPCRPLPFHTHTYTSMRLACLAAQCSLWTHLPHRASVSLHMNLHEVMMLSALSITWLLLATNVTSPVWRCSEPVCRWWSRRRHRYQTCPATVPRTQSSLCCHPDSYASSQVDKDNSWQVPQILTTPQHHCDR